MSHVRLRSLLEPDLHQPPDALAMDEVATKIFSANANTSFVRTTPTRDSQLVEPRVPNFDRLGLHEQHLVTRLLRGNHTTMHLTGGIGVGKSRFLRFFEEDILRTLDHPGAARTEHCPMVVYVDCDSFAATAASSSRDPEEITRVFSPFLFDAICAKLSRRFDVDEEVGTIWEALIKHNRESRTTNPAVSKLENILREHGLLQQSTASAGELLAKRKEIRRDFVAQPTLRGFYVAALLNYVADTHYAKHSECMFVIVDNVDPYGPVVQYCVKKVLQPLFTLSRVRVVVALRHTTERQIFGVVHASYVVDSIDYKGAGPMQVIRSRIADAIAHPELALACLADAPKARTLAFMRQLAQNLQKDRGHLSLLLQNLSGASVRKGLVYAHSLLCNSIYGPTLRSTISEGDMMRAIVVGGHRWYEQSPEQLTCNLFQVYNRHLCASFLKLRALRALHVQSEAALEMTLGALVEYLQMFGYSERMILDGINEMISCVKRLMWSDAFQQLDSIDDLITHADTHIILSDAGRAYQGYLYHRIEYVQEVMLDTLVPDTRLGRGWKFHQISDRFRLIAEFLDYLTDTEIEELEHLALPNIELERLSGGEVLFSEKMCEETANSTRRILDSVIREGGAWAQALALEIEEKLQATIERARVRRESEFPAVRSGMPASGRQ
jgi:hypothetical protein